MGGVRTDAISRRDLEVLELIARLGVAPRSVVMEWTGNGDRVNAYRRERRLLEAGYVVACPRFAGSGPVVRISRRGLKACGREELREPRYSDSRVRHALEVGRVGVAYERAGERVLFERELIARERAGGERLFSAELSRRRYHRPDFVLLDGPDPPLAVEIELSEKGGARLDEILRGWRRAIVAKKLSGVVYRCGPRARAAVERSMARTKTDQGKLIRTESL
jgi:hypothetical protein